MSKFFTFWLGIACALVAWHCERRIHTGSASGSINNWGQVIGFGAGAFLCLGGAHFLPQIKAFVSGLIAKSVSSVRSLAAPPPAPPLSPQVQKFQRLMEFGGDFPNRGDLIQECAKEIVSEQFPPVTTSTLSTGGVS